MVEKIKKIKNKLGENLLILAHHYQNSDIIQFADAVGDSLKLAQIAEKNKTAKYIVFCGVHFMAETADILTEDNQIVLLPEKKSGCPMADMADLEQTEKAWDILSDIFGNTIIPITYINSKAEIKSFCGKHFGTTVTSSNAKNIVKWGLNQKERILFLPDQNLGRNTAVDLGISQSEIAVYYPDKCRLEYNGDVKNVKVILWNGYCSVHHNINKHKVDYIRNNYPEMKIIVHPECRNEIVSISDMNGSTEYIIKEVNNSKPGSKWAVGTETNLVNRLKEQNPDKNIIILDENSSCINMNLTTLNSLYSTLEMILEHDFKNQIKVDEYIADDAKKALDIMLSLS